MEWDYNTNFYGNKRTCFLINLQLILNIYLYCFLYRNMYVIIDIITFYLVSKNLIEAKLYINLIKNLIELKLYRNPTKNLIELKLYINPTKI